MRSSTGWAHHSTIPATSNLPPWIQAAAPRGFFLFLKYPSLSHLQPSHILFLLQPGLWLFLFLGANFHTFSPSWDITSCRKPSLNPWGRRALPRVFPQHVRPLHFTWLEWHFSVFITRQWAPLCGDLTVMLTAGPHLAPRAGVQYITGLQTGKWSKTWEGMEPHLWVLSPWSCWFMWGTERSSKREEVHSDRKGKGAWQTPTESGRRQTQQETGKCR